MIERSEKHILGSLYERELAAVRLTEGLKLKERSEKHILGSLYERELAAVRLTEGL